ncbi:MAG: hypothetical protein SXA11_12135 [Cyanobacteriota bacterium]|nr:hypothetical protein [Cyanobacteriota bacterium]
MSSQLKVPDISAKEEILEISEVSSKYPQQWVTVEILQQDDYGWPAKGKVVLHSKDRSEISKSLKNLNGSLYIFYTGSIDDDAE